MLIGLNLIGWFSIILSGILYLNDDGSKMWTFLGIQSSIYFVGAAIIKEIRSNPQNKSTAICSLCGFKGMYDPCLNCKTKNRIGAIFEFK